MTPELAAFSDWVLALLPRLFLYPGGLWMLAGLMSIRLAWGGREAFQLRRWLSMLAQANLGATATAWAALALLPLPEAQPLPTSVDRWAISALLSISLLLDLDKIAAEARQVQVLAGAGITLALLAPLAREQGLLVGEAGLAANPAAWLAILPVGLGIVAMLSSGDTEMASGVRGLAWLSLALAPVWALLPDTWLTPTIVVYLVAGLLWRGAKSAKALAAAARLAYLALASQWLLALGVLLVALLFPG